MRVHYLTVSMQQESRHRLTESWDYDLGVGQGCSLIRGSTEEGAASTLPWVVGRIHFPAALGLRAFISCWLLTGDHTQLLEAPPQFLVLWNSPNWPFTSSKLAKERVSGKMEATTQCMMGVTVHHLCHLLMMKSKSRVLQTLTRREAQQGVDTRRRGSWGPAYESVCHNMQILFLLHLCIPLQGYLVPWNIMWRWSFEILKSKMYLATSWKWDSQHSAELYLREQTATCSL